MDPRTVDGLVRPGWPPLRHVERGWAALAAEERAAVGRRVEAVLAKHCWTVGARDSLAHLFTFLAQVETIAIEIPLRALPGASSERALLLRRQLVDEVFHSTLFARLAHDLALPAAQPPPPLASAERLLERIRNEPDAAVGAALLNLVAEAWIETLFRHARQWGVADTAFDAVLADEERHVEEAEAHMDGLDLAAAERAVRALEAGLLEVGSEPTVALAMLDLAGPEGYKRLAEDLEAGHRTQLAKVGLRPAAAFDALKQWRPAVEGAAVPAKVVPDTPWRLAARQEWDAPRDPTMQGAMDLRVGHIPKRLLTPVLVAAIGRAWAKQPRLNRIVARGRVWQLDAVNVGVRVLVADDELATVVIPHADKRSVRDVQRLLTDGHRQLVARRERRLRDEAAGRPSPPPPPAALDLLGPNAASFSVALSNPGKFGLESGAGAFSGHLSPSTDLTLGQRQRRPAWFGIAYLPAWHASLGCLQDHRVFDGREAGLAMSAIRAELTPAAVRRLMGAPHTVPDQRAPSSSGEEEARWLAALPPELRLIPSVGMWKYTPIVVGGSALAAGLAVGGYFLYQNLVTGAAGAAGAAGAVGGAAAGPGAATGTAGTPAAAALAHCSAMTASGTPCPNPAGPDGHCALHRPR